MAITAMFGKSFVIKILNKFGYRTTLMVNTFIIGFIIISMAIPNIHQSVYLFIPLLAILKFFQFHSSLLDEYYFHCRFQQNMTSSGNSLISVNQQLAIGFGTAFGLIVLKLFSRRYFFN